MANYRLDIHFVGGNSIAVSALDQVDDIDEFARLVSNTNSGYFTRTGNNFATMVNTNNVTYMNIVKEK